MPPWAWAVFSIGCFLTAGVLGLLVRLSDRRAQRLDESLRAGHDPAVGTFAVLADPVRIEWNRPTQQLAYIPADPFSVHQLVYARQKLAFAWLEASSRRRGELELAQFGVDMAWDSLVAYGTELEDRRLEALG